MQDRLFSPFIPYILDEHPELNERLDGFTFFPNTISFGVYTMIGTPGIFGGYDYTPYEINRHTEKTLQQKHNEAILSMPLAFSKEGWSAAVADMPYENYLEYPVTAMYKKYPQIARIETHGVYSDIWYKQNNMEITPFLSTQIKRNFILFGFFKMVPPALRAVVYHRDYWLSYNPFDDKAKFIDNYSEIDFLPELTDFSCEKDSFLLLDNEATHEAVFLQAPDYVPAETVSDHGGGAFADNEQFSSMTGILMRLADFFDYLKENNVYDNTRIIIVSDHGMGISVPDFAPFENEKADFRFKKENVTAALLVKDFNARGTLISDMTFMTNADTPALAAKDVLADARNPFTESPFAVVDKNSYAKIMVAPAQSTRIRRNTAFAVSDDQWFTVHTNIFDDANWERYIPDKAGEK
ncbi:MAG: alkaline phosphatase family protein [Bacteroides sp.]|nr:alkaline phosphatase family protein [Prevotella sp.]MCM1407855.1 alkaline phosphatase family protein [Treponema brennaborense]MCM1469597.1 alkaline phosphatase family protein [Bacteroides sp.]